MGSSRATSSGEGRSRSSQKNSSRSTRARRSSLTDVSSCTSPKLAGAQDDWRAPGRGGMTFTYWRRKTHATVAWRRCLALLGLAQELPNRRVGLPRALELRHVSAVELHVTGRRKGVLHVPHEGDRHHAVLPAPDEHGIWRELRETGPEAVVAVGLVEVDGPGRRVERGAAPGIEVGAQELVHAGGRPAVLPAGHDAAHDALHHLARRQLE